MTTTTRTLADELKAAAAKLREAATQAPEGPWAWDGPIWGDGPDGPDTTTLIVTSPGRETVATFPFKHEPGVHPRAETAGPWIALMGPNLAEPIAAWLHDFATWWDNTTAYGPDGDTTLYHAVPECGHEADTCGCFHRARDLARAINGTSASAVNA